LTVSVIVWEDIVEYVELRPVLSIVGIILVMLFGNFSARLKVRRHTTFRGEFYFFAKVIGLGTLMVTGVLCLAMMWIGVTTAPLRVDTIIPLLLGNAAPLEYPRADMARIVVTTGIFSFGVAFLLMGLPIVNHKEAWPVVAVMVIAGLLLMVFAPDIGTYMLAHARST
jgi:hypothetical protein